MPFSAPIRAAPSVLVLPILAGVVPPLAVESALGRLAFPVAAAAIGAALIGLLDRHTALGASRGLAALLVSMAAVTVGGLLLIAWWLADLLFGTGFVGGNDGAMWVLIRVTVAGLAAGALFDRCAGHLDARSAGPAGAVRGIDRDAGRPLGTRLGIGPGRQRGLVRSMQLALLASVVLGVLGGEAGLALNGAVALGITLLPAALEREADLPIDAGLALWVTTAVFLHALGTFGLYDDSFWWNNLTHFTSATVVGAAGYTVLRAVDARSPALHLPPRPMAVVVVLFVFSAGVGWEIAEFGIDVGLGGLGYGDLVTAQYGLADTMTDLAANALGAAVVATWGSAHLTGVAGALSDRLGETEP